jgi:drug/metabolite transporter (DMT)-like permease
MLAIVLALGTSVAYGTSNLLGPLLNRRHPLASVLLVGQFAALFAAGLLVLFSGEPPPGREAILIAGVAGAGNIGGLACLLKAAQYGSVSIVAAIGALGTALPVVVGLVTGDALSAFQVAGIVCAIAGATLAAQRSDHAHLEPAGVMWSLIAALFFGVFLVALPEAAESGTVWALLDARIAVCVFLVLGIAVLRAEVSAPGRDLPLMTVPGLLLLAGTLMYAEATSRGLLSVSAVLASLATVVTAALAFVVWHERLSKVQWAGIAVATLGVVLLAL